MRIAVIGAGVAGLCAGHRLADAGHEVDVYERWPGLGGLAATLDVGGHRLERYYHHLFTSDEHIAALCDEIGLGGELETWPSTVAMFAEGSLHPFTTPLDLLRYPPMSPLARLRMGLAVVNLQRRHRSVEPFEGITIRRWVERSMGRQAYAKVWGPLLQGKFGDRADRVSMSWLWAKLQTRRQTTGEEARREVLVYPRGSFEAISERLRERIEASGGRVLLDEPVVSIDRDGGGLVLTRGEAESWRRGYDPRAFATRDERRVYEGVIATVPSDIFERLLGEGVRQAIGADYLRRLGSIEYFAALCVLLELDRRFSPYYWTNVADPELPFIGLIEHTNLVPAERYGGRRFMYVANYLPHDHELLDLELDELLDRYEPGLRSVNDDFERAWIQRAWVFRDPAAQPIVLPNYRDRMPLLETGVPGLVLANTTQVYPEDRGTNYAVRLADQAVRALLSQRRPIVAGRGG